MILAYVIWAAYELTFVRGWPFEPIQGRSVTAALMIFDEPSAERNEVKKERRFAESEVECKFPAPDSPGYSQSISIPTYSDNVMSIGYMVN